MEASVSIEQLRLGEIRSPGKSQNLHWDQEPLRIAVLQPYGASGFKPSSRCIMKSSLRLLALLTVVASTAWGQDWAKERLEKSPRHLEFIKVKNGAREVKCFIAFPEVKEKAPVVLVIHEIFGLSDWVRSLTDQFAEAGYIAIAPDLLSGVAPGGGGTAELGSGDEVRKAIQALPQDQIAGDLNAVAKHALALPASNWKLAAAGFCWGGGQVFRFGNHPDLKAGFAFYGSGPDSKEGAEPIKAPIYGFYGENDARINAGVPKTTEAMKDAGKTYEPVTYPGAGHGFMRAGEAPDANEANKAARAEAWKRLKEKMKGLL
jgi:carboxymethylenebutenolidase